jgi:hypothetical protein
VKANAAKGHGRSGNGVPGRHQVVDDHHLGRPGRLDSLWPSDELARGGGPALGRGELGTVRPVRRQPEDQGDSGCDAPSAKGAGRMPGQPLDVLTTAATRHRTR